MRIRNLMFVTCAILISCDKCYDDCAPALVVNLEVINSAQKNLFSQPNPSLFFDSVRIITVYHNFVDSSSVTSNERKGKAVISFIAGSPSIKEYIVKYSSDEADTLTFTNYVYDKNECCSKVKHYDLQLNHLPYCTACNDEFITIIK